MSIWLFVDDPGKTLFPMDPTWADLNKLLYSIKTKVFAFRVKRLILECVNIVPIDSS